MAFVETLLSFIFLWTSSCSPGTGRKFLRNAKVKGPLGFEIDFHIEQERDLVVGRDDFLLFYLLFFYFFAER